MEFTNEMILTVSAIVAAYVTVFKGFKLLDTKFLPLVALAIAAYYVLIPSVWFTKSITISVIGLTAAGVYSMTKNKEDAKK